MLKAYTNKKKSTLGFIQDSLSIVFSRNLLEKAKNYKEIHLDVQKGLVVHVLLSYLFKASRNKKKIGPDVANVSRCGIFEPSRCELGLGASGGASLPADISN